VEGLVVEGLASGLVEGVWLTGGYCECISEGAWCKVVRHCNWCIGQTMCCEGAAVGAAWRVQWIMILREHHNSYSYSIWHGKAVQPTREPEAHGVPGTKPSLAKTRSRSSKT
jgi:hypothetical protein